MRNLLFLVFTWVLSFSVSAQEIPAGPPKTITGDHYQLIVPENFRHIRNPVTGGPGLEQFFEASGIGLPIMFNRGPLIVTVFLVRENCSSLEECKNSALEGYRQNPDRVFPSGWQDRQEKFILSDGGEAVFIHTRFYRTSKELHQSRFDLVVYSEKAKQGYFYALSVQHVDDTYKIEADLDLPAFAKSLFSRFQLR